MTRRQPLTDRRIRLLLVLLVVAFGAALGRAVWLQAVKGAPLGALAARQQRETVDVPASRGAIYDRSGVGLAIGERATTVYADPRLVRNRRALAVAAGRTLGIDADRLYERLADRSSSFVYVQRKADPDRAARLERLELPGLGFYPEERRAYPQGTVGAHVLGFAGVDNNGLAGLEKSLDGILTGSPGRETLVKDGSGRVIDVVESRAEQEGTDVFLTLDQHLQANVEDVLRRTAMRWRATSASAVVLDPRTGSILALAVAPGFDANRFGDAPPNYTRNRALTDTYEPGSTFKLITVAGALAEGIASPRTIYTLPYSIQIADRVIREAHYRPTKRMMVAEILAQSSNVGTIKLAQALDEERLARWIDRFGFGRRTGVEFPGESPGIVVPRKRWSGSTIGNVPLGQGIAVTPVQMAAAYAAVANGGVWVQPHLVGHVEGGEPARPKRRRLVSREVADRLAEMLQGVVDAEGGTGALARVEGYHVAGKTGTAAKPKPGGYSSTRYVASFVGFVPATAPRLVVLVTVDEPRRAIWGGVVAAPAFQEIARFGLQYLQVPPDNVDAS